MHRVRTVSLTGFDGYSSGGSGGGGSQMASPSGSMLTRTASSSSRPSSGRSRGIQTLIDAIRSKSEWKLHDALEAFRQPNGEYLGEETRGGVASEIRWATHSEPLYLSRGNNSKLLSYHRIKA